MARKRSWILGIVSIGILAWGIWGLWLGAKVESVLQGQQFAKTSLTARGSVVALSHCLDGKAYGDYPLVQFTDARGNQHLAWDQSSCHSFLKGENVIVHYQSGDPTIIITQNNLDSASFDLWLTVGILAAMLPIFLLLAPLLWIVAMPKKKKLAAS